MNVIFEQFNSIPPLMRSQMRQLISRDLILSQVEKRN